MDGRSQSQFFVIKAQTRNLSSFVRASAGSFVFLAYFRLNGSLTCVCVGDVRNPKQTITQKNLLLTNDKSTDPSHNNPPPPLTYLPTYLPLALWVLSEKGSPKNAITTARTDWDWMTDSVLCTTLVNASFNVCATQFA